MPVLTPTRHPLPPLDSAALAGSIPDRFDAVASAAPHRCAIRTPEGNAWSYEALQQRTDRLGHWLVRELASSGHSSGESAGVPIVTLLPQGADAISLQLGILKARCAYVPFDPRHPPARLAELVDHVGAGLVVTDSRWIDVARRVAPGRARLLDESMDESHSGAGIRPRASPASFAYIYYTSGTTGRPKGVVDSHRNVLHNILRYTRNLRIGPEDRLTLLQSPAFSGAVSSTYCALLNGATLCPYDLESDGPAGLADWLAASGITIFHSVPSIFRAWVAGRGAFPAMRIIRLEGDRALANDVELFRKHFSPSCVLVNGLGTTETGIAAQYFVDQHSEIESGLLPVGQPAPDVELLILDEAGRPLPRGSVGEIAVRSRYLALGYWRDPERTGDRFLADPEGGDLRIYRTGDAGRLRPDGCLEHLGRRDFVLRVRGQAVDPAEVEQALTGIPEVGDAGVTGRVREDGEVDLVAFVVPAGAYPLSPESMRDALRGKLENRLIPALIEWRDALPLTTFGKLDRHALAHAAANLQRVTPYVAPQDVIEVQLRWIWEDALRRGPIGVADDFVELGGDSLAAAGMLEQIQRMLGIELPIDVLWRDGRNIRGMAATIRAGSERSPWTRAIAIKPAGGRAPLFCTPVVGGHLYFYDRVARHLEVDRPVYGLPAQGVADRKLPHTSIEDMAAHAIRLMRDVQAEGPYALLGYCSGAVVAFEMARQLEAAGQAVALLALVDSEAPNDRLGEWTRILGEAATGNDLRLLQERIYHALLRPAGLARMRRLEKPGEAHRWALWSYQPGSIAGRAVLIRPDAGGRAGGWARLVKGGVEVRTLAGAHGDLVQAEGAVRLARELTLLLA